jgi:hypothetical protein
VVKRITLLLFIPEVRGSNLGILSEQVDEGSPKPAQVPPS